MAENLRISTDSQGFLRVILDDHEIADVDAYTLQEGFFDPKRREYTRKLTLEILLGPTREVTVQL